jgi:hypothetical protein
MVLEEKDRGGHERPAALCPRAARVRPISVEQADDVRAEILSQAAALRADLLVLGSHGRSGFERLLLGSVTERLLHQATCPTMIVPRRSPDAPDAPVQFRRILCGVDFRGIASRTDAGDWPGWGAHAHLTVLHVIGSAGLRHPRRGV